MSPVAADPIPGQKFKSPPSLSTENEDTEYEVEKIIGTHFKNGKLHYLVRWKGYGPEDDWSIPHDQTNGFKKLVKEFHDINPYEPNQTKNRAVSKSKPKKNFNSKAINVPRRSSARLKGE